jgi:A/G-specific adenine glycosylase
VLAAWSGLGYYRRARMLHDAATQIVNERSGMLPETSQDLRTLPGIGRYTAAAIASIAFDEPVAVVDGNVTRVLERLQGERLTREDAWGLAQRWVSRNRPGDFNQALMELGATVCLPREPRCLVCPLLHFCVAKGALAPGKKGQRRKRELYYSLYRRNGSVFLVQRAAEASLMPEMWELPEITGGAQRSTHRGPLLSLRHSITVTDYTVHVLKQRAPGGVKGCWIPCSDLPDLPLTGLTRKILRKAGMIGDPSARRALTGNDA